VISTGLSDLLGTPRVARFLSIFLLLFFVLSSQSARYSRETTKGPGTHARGRASRPPQRVPSPRQGDTHTHADTNAQSFLFVFSGVFSRLFFSGAFRSSPHQRRPHSPVKPNTPRVLRDQIAKSVSNPCLSRPRGVTRTRGWWGVVVALVTVVVVVGLQRTARKSETSRSRAWSTPPTDENDLEVFFSTKTARSGRIIDSA
jgi:hypothetical protein